ncbi:MAG: sulfatase-like hydrolase/transferase [Bacteroidales bacterium]|nr:sulfatase-like hydrolase/transferase [Bacteroidales bacterium]
MQKLRYSGNPQTVLVLRLLLVLLLMVFTRLLIYFLHPSLFPGITPLKLIYYTFAGMRFDTVAILYTNALYIFLLVIPFRFRRKRTFSIITDIIFYASNIILLIPNLADTAYYPFSLKRMTIDIFRYISTGDDTANMMPQFIRDYWYVLLLLLTSVFLLVFIARRIRISNRYVMQKNSHYYLSQTLSMLLFFALLVLGVRGGLQLKPVGILSASQYAPSQETAVVLNSAFTLMRSYGQEGLQKISFYKDEKELDSIFNPEKNYSSIDSLGKVIPMQKKNVFVIILESFSAEHIGALTHQERNNKTDFTPFLDSLATKSIVYEGFANGKRSIEGIPAILASLPTWMTEDFITSQYASGKFNSLASLLKTEGYTTSFFHGGKNGTMGFDAFCQSAGFDTYYGKNEYPNQSDFDGNWGIWDEPYLQYIAGTLNTLPQPFMSAVFTLSSHHPYKVPEKYKNKFSKGPLEIQQTIMYTDYALKKFFEKASTMPWFQNTIFVITADHTSEAWQAFYKNRVGQYYIPVIFYEPQGDRSAHQRIVAQQTDIMPTILDMLHYPNPFVAFGGSLLRNDEPRFSLSYLNGNYQLIQDGYAWQTDHTVSEALYHFQNDSLLSKDISKSQKNIAEEKDKLLKAIIQQYNNRLIENKLSIK